jgi:hypothetical protein
MKTNDLIDLLANGAELGAPPKPRWGGVPLVLASVFASMVLMKAWLGVRPDLAQAAGMPAFWIKLGFVALLAAAARHAAGRLSLPGARTAALPALIALPIVLIWSVGALVWWQAPPEARAQLFWGLSWRSCPLLIAALSVPVLVAMLTVMRGLAPTRLRLAGAAAGLAAGATAATVYCLHCPEMSSVFVGVWYLTGILIPCALGAMIGPRVLAW